MCVCAAVVVFANKKIFGVGVLGCKQGGGCLSECNQQCLPLSACLEMVGDRSGPDGPSTGYGLDADAMFRKLANMDTTGNADEPRTTRALVCNRYMLSNGSKIFGLPFRLLHNLYLLILSEHLCSPFLNLCAIQLSPRPRSGSK